MIGINENYWGKSLKFFLATGLLACQSRVYAPTATRFAEMSAPKQPKNISFTLDLAKPAAPESSLHSSLPKNIYKHFDKDKFSAVVMDALTGKVLYGINENEKRYPASMVKLMTLFLTYEAMDHGYIQANDTLKIGKFDDRPHIKKLCVMPGEVLTVQQASDAAYIPSANDAANIIAENAAGSVEKFVDMMNVRGQSLGMYNTHFKNPCGVNEKGVSDPGQYTTAYDMALLERAEMQYLPKYCENFKKKQMRFHGITLSTHFNIKGADIGKTGLTNASGFNVACTFPTKDSRLIVVVMGGKSAKERDKYVLSLYEEGKKRLLKEKTENAEMLVNKNGLFPNMPAAKNINTLEDITKPAWKNLQEWEMKNNFLASWYTKAQPDYRLAVLNHK